MPSDGFITGGYVTNWAALSLYVLLWNCKLLPQQSIQIANLKPRYVCSKLCTLPKRPKIYNRSTFLDCGDLDFSAV